MIPWPIARRYSAYSQALAFMLSRMLIGVVVKALVQHGVNLVLAHVLEFPRLDISQTDVFHDNLRIFGDSASRSSSFCYQIVVRETENRQLLHFLVQPP
jgi:hypothetical protein